MKLCSQENKELTKRNVYTGWWTLSNCLKILQWQQDPDTIHEFMNSWIHEFMTDYVATMHISITNFKLLVNSWIKFKYVYYSKAFMINWSCVQQF